MYWLTQVNQYVQPALLTQRIKLHTLLANRNEHVIGYSINNVRFRLAINLD